MAGVEAYFYNGRFYFNNPITHYFIIQPIYIALILYHRRLISFKRLWLYLVDDFVSGRGRRDTESETITRDPYHPKTEPNNEFLIPNIIMSLKTKQKHNIDNSV